MGCHGQYQGFANNKDNSPLNNPTWGVVGSISIFWSAVKYLKKTFDE